jgi:hypothetical protein
VIVRFGQFFENCRISPHFGLLFPRLKICIVLAGNGSGDILGDFFRNSSGHYESDPRKKIESCDGCGSNEFDTKAINVHKGKLS